MLLVGQEVADYVAGHLNKEVLQKLIVAIKINSEEAGDAKGLQCAKNLTIGYSNWYGEPLE